jgi:hypothetical protein
MVMDEFEAVGGSLAFVQLIRIWGWCRRSWE